MFWHSAGSHREQEKKPQNTHLDECKDNEMVMSLNIMVRSEPHMPSTSTYFMYLCTQAQMKQNGHIRQPKRQKAKGRSNRVIMDEEQTIISGQMYQAWIRDASDIVSRRGRDRKVPAPYLPLGRT